jgi:hypothetical protein
MEVRTCDHLKEDGVYCNSPALRGRDYCYFHLNLRGRRLKAARTHDLGPGQPINLPFPEDMHAVQVSLFEVLNGLANHRIDPKHAGLMLYALQQAATNLMHTPGWHGRCQPVEPDQPLLALEYPDFEERYHLTEDVDLEADPEAALREVGQGAPPLSPDSGARVGPPPQMPPLAAASSEANNDEKNRKNRRRADRVPLPKGLWTMKDPDAPFRAYTSDGRELTYEDAKRWQQREFERMAAFVLHGDPEAPLSPEEMPGLDDETAPNKLAENAA